MNMLKLTPLRFVLLLGALHLLCASLSFAAPAVEKNTLALEASVPGHPSHEASWKMNLSGVAAEEPLNPEISSQYISFNLEAQTRYWLHPVAYISLAPAIKFENGSYQSLDGERKGGASLTVKEAGAHWLFSGNSTLSAGALNQAANHSELLIGDQAFPALRVQIQTLETGAFKSSLNLQQAIPTSASLSAQTKDSEGTPRFVSGGLSLDYQTARSFWKTQLGAFSYENLPGTVAVKSGQRGNSTLALSEDEALFVHRYQGLEAMTSLRLPLFRAWDLLVSASYLENLKAPKELNRAYAVTAGSEFYFSGNKSLELKFTGFHIEPDATVAFFSSSKYSYTNRVGYSVESFINFKKYGFHAGGRWTEAEVIYLSPTQNREKSVMLILETSHADI